MIIMIVIGLISGIISGLGIGGGTILIPALTIIYSMKQQTAQNINLIYFIPTAIIALVSHVKDGNIEKGIVKPFVLFGVAGAILGSLIAVNLDSDFLRKIFGGFLLIMGIIEFRKRSE